MNQRIARSINQTGELKFSRSKLEKPVRLAMRKITCLRSSRDIVAVIGKTVETVSEKSELKND
ncbi:hypothetical protein [Leptolyngbya ohadii]|uniref:hypothetical protein n=1 Tax=Leptolyngbya ohadii TaxID=1962290 RepID=UPI000B59A225|nr:hypothetical protein [Leptolyngbya ohadii]